MLGLSMNPANFFKNLSLLSQDQALFACVCFTYIFDNFTVVRIVNIVKSGDQKPLRVNQASFKMLEFLCELITCVKWYLTALE